MTYDEEPHPKAESEQHKTIFNVRVLRVVDQDAVFVHKGRLSLRESDAVPPNIGLILPPIPFEAESIHASHYTYSVVNELRGSEHHARPLTEIHFMIPNRLL